LLVLKRSKMLDSCVALIPRLDITWLNEILVIALYFPLFSWPATWIISAAFYDGEMFFTNIFVNYLVFSVLYYISRMTGIVSPVIQPCDSFFFDLYRYIFPSSTYVVTIAYYLLVVLHHRRKKDLWWKNRSSLSSWILVSVIIVFPLGYTVALWYYDVMTIDIIFFNFILVSLLVVLLTEFTNHNYYWKRSVSRINIYMGWKA
jgi:hypothetical protein